MKELECHLKVFNEETFDRDYVVTPKAGQMCYLRIVLHDVEIMYLLFPPNIDIFKLEWL